MIDLSQSLSLYQNQGLTRQRKPRKSPQSVKLQYSNTQALNFCSNDYLGLANEPQIVKAYKRGLNLYGVGSGASNLVSGYTDAAYDLEQQFAAFLGYERCLFLANGYMANLSAITTLANKNSAIFADKYNHASLIDAVTLSGAHSYRYAHGNLLHLAQLLDKCISPNKLLVSDGVFSMEGSMANLPELHRLALTHDAILLVDDAHGIGVLGLNGRGCMEHFNIKPNILCCPLGKAFGGYGAIIASNNDFIEGLIQFARPYIYTTAPPPALAYSMQTSLKLVQTENWRREKLMENIRYFKNTAAQYGLAILASDTAIQSLLIGTTNDVMSISQKLYERGFVVGAMRYPTVPKHTARLRITLSSLHSTHDIAALLQELAKHYENLS
jgi:8-amino-7-oxononanoate synthase